MVNQRILRINTKTSRSFQPKCITLYDTKSTLSLHTFILGTRLLIWTAPEKPPQKCSNKSTYGVSHRSPDKTSIPVSMDFNKVSKCHTLKGRIKIYTDINIAQKTRSAFALNTIPVWRVNWILSQQQARKTLTARPFEVQADRGKYGHQ